MKCVYCKTDGIISLGPAHSERIVEWDSTAQLWACRDGHYRYECEKRIRALRERVSGIVHKSELNPHNVRFFIDQLRKIALYP